MGKVVGWGVGIGVGIAMQIVSPISPAVHHPAWQLWQVWYIVLSWYFPDGQCKQLVSPVHAWYLPTLQFLQASPLVG